MKQRFLLLSVVLPLIFNSCGKKEEVKTNEVVTETVVDSVYVPVAIDSVAVHDHYEAEHHLKKVEKKVTPKVYKGKKVSVVSHPTIHHHDVLTPQIADKNNPKVIVIHDEKMVYHLPSEDATFPGGEKEFDAYIMKNVEYPDTALDKGVEGVVYANMYLDENGTVTDVDFPGKKLGSGLEQEAKRMLLKSPRWNPAKYEGKAVKSKLVLPIKFKIDK
jgi:outer membrane biosynthesis protein TonB